MGSEDNAPTGAPAGPPHGNQQPRWAWWVVGIVVPLAGVLITILLTRSDSSQDDGKADASAVTEQPVSATPGTPEQPAASPTKSAAADQVLWGPDAVEAETTDNGSYIELDTSGPIVQSTSKGADVIFWAPIGDPGLFVPESASHLALLPASGPAPTAEDCAGSVERNGSYSADVKRGDRFCLMTDEGRVAYLKVLSAPDRGTGELEVTVWETPAA